MVRSRKKRNLLEIGKYIGLLLLLSLLAWLAWSYWPMLVTLMSDEQALEAFIEKLGWFGPLMFVALNAMQIVVAPIPGYIIQAAAGFLYGPLWGGVWAGCGLLCGSMLAMFLSRRFGRPLAAWLVGERHLARWDTVTGSSRPLLWFLLILAPIGDISYFLAGLSKVSYLQIVLFTMMVRLPTVFFTAAVGSGVIGFSRTQFIVFIMALGLVFLILMRYQERLFAWIDGTIQQRLRI